MGTIKIMKIVEKQLKEQIMAWALPAAIIEAEKYLKRPLGRSEEAWLFDWLLEVAKKE